MQKLSFFKQFLIFEKLYFQMFLNIIFNITNVPFGIMFVTFNFQI